MYENFIVENIESLEKKIESVRSAQKEFSKYSQEQVDRIFKKLRLRLI